MCATFFSSFDQNLLTLAITSAPWLSCVHRRRIFLLLLTGLCQDLPYPPQEPGGILIFPTHMLLNAGDGVDQRVFDPVRLQRSLVKPSISSSNGNQNKNRHESGRLAAARCSKAGPRVSRGESESASSTTPHCRKRRPSPYVRLFFSLPRQ